ncbi:hypothetical protein AAF712_008767 [Marasmius tenuissimus]|uniref:Uncharacterized protein n=1 Tax=Marasmius tenuissimus TaxID=585030 RepID=A0ABR2ZT76_9AGAR
MSQKATDAANNAPYLTHLVGHRRQLSLVPPDNAGRMRQAKQKKQRSGNPDDELRFNTGPKFYKVSTSSRANSDARPHPRSSRTSRRTGEVRENEYVDDGSSIPNYPPPSFDEAMSSPPISICPSTGTFINPSSRTVHSYSPNSASPSTPQMSPGASASSASPEDLSDNDSDSDASLMASARSSSPYEPPSPSGMEVSRSPTPGSTMGDLEAEYDAEMISAPNTPTSSKPCRSRLSLSPLRTLLPRRSSSSTRAISAHPYCQSTNPSSFFRSTTSLSTFTFGRSTTSPPDAEEDKGEQEDFESWEVVRRPTSLLFNVEMAMSTKTAPEGLPTESLSTPPPSEPVRSHTTVPPSAPPSSLPSVPPSAPPLPPLVDKKTPFPKPKVKKEPKRRDTTQSQTTMPNASPPGLETGPILTTVRTRRTYSPSPATQRAPIPGSPLRSEASYPQAQPQAILEKAINTPLPITPTEKAVDNKERGGVPPLSPFPAAATSSFSSSLDNQTIAPLQNVRGPMRDGRQDYTQTRSHSSISYHNSRAPSPDVLARTSAHAFPTLSRPVMPPINTNNVQEGPASRRGSPSPIPPTPSSSSTYTITPTHTPTQSHFAHHYLGRPLPRPPPSFSRDMVDSTYASSVAESFVSSASTMCPEGLLIDFDEPAQPSCPATPVPTLMYQRGEVLEGGRSSRLTQWSTSSNRHSHVFGRTLSPAEQASRNRTESATRAASVTEPNPRGELSHFTDLDLLVAGLDDSQLQDGSGYDVHHTTDPAHGLRVHGSSFSGPSLEAKLQRQLSKNHQRKGLDHGSLPTGSNPRTRFR